MKKETLYTEIPVFDPETGHLNVVVETPQGFRNKFKYNERYGIFSLTKVLPSGAVFPFDFGYVPGTLGGDEDPLDVLLLMDEPVFVGCLVAARLVGVIEAEQTEEGRTLRNDRLIAVAIESNTHGNVQTLDDLSDMLVKEIEHFFKSYNAIKDRKFEVVGRNGPERAAEIVREGMERAGERE